MELFVIVVLICLADNTQGAGCKEGQHCSDCNVKGDCLQDCDKGFYGLKCQSQCSSTCRYNTCKLAPGKGTYTCTHGCVPGYQGTRCNRPCDRHVVNCTQCPGGCDGEYCHLGDGCFAGCRDSMYGSGCKACPSNCRTCNGMTGLCDTCDPTHYGVNCEKTCGNCAGSCEADCECAPGFYGDFCAETCSKTCRLKSAHNCLPVVTSDSCTGECDKHNATCLHGCVDGWFGPRCSSPCNPGCRHQRCNAAGSCAEGCELHHFGSTCEPCPENCANRTCDQTSGVCVTDCSKEGSGPNCKQTCSTPDCSTGYHKIRHYKRTRDVPPAISSTTLIWVLGAVVVSFVVASSVCCLCFHKGPCTQRSSQAVTDPDNTSPEQGDATHMDYHVHKYREIKEDEATLKMKQNHEGISDGSDGRGDRGGRGGSDGAVPVLADCFLGYEDVDFHAGSGDADTVDVDVKAEDGTTGSSGSIPDRTYTHLTKDVPAADPRAVVSYISPLED